MKDRFVLRGSLCYSLDAQHLCTIEKGYLVCEDGLSLGTYETLPEAYKAWPLQDYGDALITPGLVDLHVHAPQFAYRTLGMDLELLEWLQTRTFPEEAKYASLDYAAKVYPAFVADLVKGPNTRASIFATCHVPATTLLMDLLEQSGLVTMVGKVNMDQNATPDLQEASAEQSLSDTSAWIEQVKGRYARTYPILTPRFVPSCTDDLLRGLGVLARGAHVPVQSHLSENLDECALVASLYPEAGTYGQVYADAGLFGGDVMTIMAHCVWSTDAEIALMRRQGVFIAHCPQSNTNISSGIAPVRRYLEEGIPMGLGSDVAGGCHTSIFRAMTDAIQASKLRWRLSDDALAPLTLAEAFYLATAGGGAFFGKVGSFAAGYELDALVIDDGNLAAPFPLTIEERLARVAYLSDDRNILRKYVRGQEILAK